MASGFTLTGGDKFLKRLGAAHTRADKAIKAAAKESLELLQSEAIRFLEAEIAAHGGGDAFESPLRQNQHDSVFKSFVQEFASVGAGAFSASLKNTSGHALFLEKGTDNEGTGSHFVPVVSGFALAWMDKASGEMMFARGVEVKGIKPYRFMERALFENKGAVRAIFAKHAKKILR